MNRRDMIIVATLMNTGLLAVLFMMAIQSDNTGSNEQATIPQPQTLVADTTINTISHEPILNNESTLPITKTSRHDELDKVINSYSTVVPPKPMIMEEDLFQDDVSEPTSGILDSKETQQIGTIEEPATDSVEVTVKRGDSLDKIARANKTSVKAIKKANNLTTDRLKIGQVLTIPRSGEIEKVASTPKTTPKPEVATSSTSGAEYYTIKSGDNPWKIAKQFGVRFEQLLKLNGLDEAKARRLKAGDKIRVR
jgi:LysM repeat protein